MTVTRAQFERLALELEGATAAPHFDRIAYKVVRTFATLAADGRSANLKLLPDEQAMKCAAAPEVFAPVPNAWGAQGWTTMDLSTATTADAKAALETAWRHALPKPRRKQR
jgi:hypothetical protein